MFIQQLYTGYLSEASYYVESNGEAAIIDPIREIYAYLNLATSKKSVIKHIFGTHFHADFVSGNIDLVNKIGASIIYGPETVTSYPVTIASDGEQFFLGKSVYKFYTIRGIG